MECGLSPEQFWDYSWYELNLISQRTRYQMETQWNHTRHIMAVLTGESAKNIMPLSFDKSPVAVTTPEDAQRILDKYKHLLKPKDE